MQGQPTLTVSVFQVLTWAGGIIFAILVAVVSYFLKGVAADQRMIREKQITDSERLVKVETTQAAHGVRLNGIDSDMERFWLEQVMQGRGRRKSDPRERVDNNA